MAKAKKAAPKARHKAKKAPAPPDAVMDAPVVVSEPNQAPAVDAGDVGDIGDADTPHSRLTKDRQHARDATRDQGRRKIWS